jgi:hypothetical protein
VFESSKRTLLRSVPGGLAEATVSRRRFDSDEDAAEGEEVGRSPKRREKRRRRLLLVDGCVADLSKCWDYHRWHKVCEAHSKTLVVVAGHEMRFCQQWRRRGSPPAAPGCWMAMAAASCWVLRTEPGRI